MQSVTDVLARVPEAAKDARLTLTGALQGNVLTPVQRAGVAMAAAMTAGADDLAQAFSADLSPEDQAGVQTAVALMGMTNVWYTFVDFAADEQLSTIPPQLRMVSYAKHGGVAKVDFELYALAASLVGKCRPCISAHVRELRGLSVPTDALRDVGRIAASVNAVSKFL